MELVTLVCQNCGTKAQPEAGRGVICPCCGNEMSPMPADTDAAFAQDMQFAPPPLPDDEQTHPQFLQETQPLPELPIQPEQFASTAPRYTPEQLAQAKKKRGYWHFMNIAMPVIQAVVLGAGVTLNEADNNYGVLLIMTWLMSVPVCGFLSALLRPDDAYLDKPPAFKTKVMQGIIQSIAGTIISFAGAGSLCAIFEDLL